MTWDSKNLLPSWLTSNPFWRAYLDASQEEVWDPTIDLIKKVGDLRRPSQVEAAYLTAMLENLGLFIDTETITEAQLRRIIDLLPQFYEKSGTQSTFDLLSFLKSTGDHIVTVEPVYLYSRRDVDRETVPLAGVAPYSYTGVLAKPPIVPGSLAFAIGSEAWTEENGILTGTGKPNPADVNLVEYGTGSLDHETGNYHLDIKQEYQPISHNGIGGTFKLKHREGETAEVETSNLHFNASASEIKTALDGILKQVKGEALFRGSDVVRHSGAFLYPPIEKRSVRFFPKAGATAWEDREAQAFHLTSNKQSISISNATGGTFTLTHNGETTEAIRFNIVHRLYVASIVSHGTFSLYQASPQLPPPQSPRGRRTANISPSGVQRIRRHVDVSGGRFTLTYDGQETDPIMYNANAQGVYSALLALSNVTALAVSGEGSQASPWQVVFINPSIGVSDLVWNDVDLGGESVGDKITIERVSAAEFIKEELEDLEWIYKVTVAGDGTESSPWEITYIDPISNVPNLQVDDGSLTLMGGESGDESRLVVIQPADVIEERLENLNNLSNVSVTGSMPWEVEFNDANSYDLPLLTVNTNRLTATESDASVSATVKRVRSATSGTFTLSYNGASSDGINPADSIDDIETRLSRIPSFGHITVVGEGTLESPWYVSFSYNGNKSNLSLLETNENGLTGGSIVAHGKREILVSRTGDTRGFGPINHTTGAYSIRFNSTQSSVEAKSDYNSDALRATVSGAGSAKDPWLVLYKYYGNEKKLLTAEASLFPSAAKMDVVPNISVNYDTRQYQGFHDSYKDAFQLVSKGSGVESGFFKLGYREATNKTPAIPVNGVVRRFSLNREVTGGNFKLVFRRARKVSSHSRVTGGDFILVYGGQRTVPIAHNATAAQVRTALGGASNLAIENIEVTGPDGGPWVVIFSNSIGEVAVLSADYSGLEGVPANEKGATVTIEGGNVTGETSNQGIEVNLVQEVVIDSKVTGGTFTLRYNNQETGNIAHNAPATGANSVQSALETLSTITDASVQGAGVLSSPWVITFQTPSSNISRITANGANLTGGDDLPASALRVNVRSNVAQEIGEAVQGIAGLTSVEVKGSGTSTDPWIMKFEYAGVPGYMTVDETNLTGGSGDKSIVENEYTSAELIQSYLENLDGVNKVAVTGTGEAGNPWKIKFIDPDPKSAFALDVEKIRVRGTGTGDVINVAASREDGQLTSAGGDWYLTNQVDVRVNEDNVEENRAFIDDLERTFYQVAPATMVMRSASGLREIEGPTEITSYLTEKQFVKIEVPSDEYVNPQVVSIKGSPNGGTFTLTFNNLTTDPIAHNAPATGANSVQDRLNALAGVTVTVTGTPGVAYTVTFTQPTTSIPLLIPDDEFTSGDEPKVVVSDAIVKAEFDLPYSYRLVEANFAVALSSSLQIEADFAIAVGWERE